MEREKKKKRKEKENKTFLSFSFLSLRFFTLVTSRVKFDGWLRNDDSIVFVNCATDGHPAIQIERRRIFFASRLNRLAAIG